MLRWMPLLTLVIGLFALVSGLYESPQGPPWYGILIAAMLFFLALADLSVRLSGRPLDKGLRSIQGPLLWSLLLILGFRITDFSAPVEALLYSFFLFVLLLTQPSRIFSPPLLLIPAAQGLLALAGHLSLRFFAVQLVLMLTGASLGWALAGGRGAAFARTLFNRSNAATRQPLSPAPVRSGGRTGVSCRELASRSLEMKLEQLRQCLDLTSVVLLRSSSGQSRLDIVSGTFGRQELKRSGLALGTGLTGALETGMNDLWVAPARGALASMPYYDSPGDVGGCFVLRLDSQDGPVGTSHLLIGDRLEEQPWTEREKITARNCGENLLLTMALGDSVAELAQERDSVRHFCSALRELNGVMELDAVFDATVKVARSILDAEFVTLSLVEEQGHRVVRAEGDDAAALLGKLYAVESGLVGQALKFRKTLPAGGKYPGAAPVFDEKQLFTRFRSLLVIPLQEEDCPPVGVLTVASGSSGLFTSAAREILELLASQVAIKIDLAHSHDQLSKMARIDALTGLSNRGTFEQALEKMMERSKRTGAPLSLLLCDIDHFKKVNDTYGHPFGDEVLRTVGAILAEEVRAIDLAARYGGEEFVLLLEDCDISDAYRLAERIRIRIAARQFSFEGRPVHVSMSFGLAVYPADAEGGKMLIDCADRALYRAKERGRNRVELWALSAVSA